MQIEIDFDVYKALTAKRESESHTFNDVLREILELDSIHDAEATSVLDQVSDALSRPLGAIGFFSKGVHLPDGTLIKARYKQQEFRAKIIDGKWLDEAGREHASASAAAAAITGTNVNGLRFWEARRPSDSGWRRLELLRSQ